MLPPCTLVTNKFFTVESGMYKHEAKLPIIVWLYCEVIWLYWDIEHPLTVNDRPINIKGEEGLTVANEVRVGVCVMGENDGSSDKADGKVVGAGDCVSSDGDVGKPLGNGEETAELNDGSK